jgi:hypothetical protein
VRVLRLQRDQDGEIPLSWSISDAEFTRVCVQSSRLAVFGGRGMSFNICRGTLGSLAIFTAIMNAMLTSRRRTMAAGSDVRHSKGPFVWPPAMMLAPAPYTAEVRVIRLIHRHFRVSFFIQFEIAARFKVTNTERFLAPSSQTPGLFVVRIKTPAPPLGS